MRTHFTALMAGAAFAASVTASPALAQEGPGFLGSIVQGILGGGPSGNEIEYRERAPLVVPPRTGLPQPQVRPSERNANWPSDPDVQRRRAAENPGIFDGFIGRPQAQAEGPRIRLSPNELAAGRVAGQPLPDREPLGGRPNSVLDDNANSVLRIPQQQMRANDAARAQARAEEPVGREPPRRYLTEPPQGFRSATERVAPGAERPVDRSDDLGVRQFQRQQSNR